jgi:hypothetical protein
MDQSLLTCPHCHYQSLEEVPTDRCEDFHECDHCHQTFAAAQGDCCVFKSFGDRPCGCDARVPLSTW